MSGRQPSAGSWLASPPPSVALDVTAARVVGVALAEQSGRWVVSAHASEPLPEGAVEPVLNAPNVHDQAALSTAIAAVLRQLGSRVRRVGLVLPDSVAKVSLLRFDKVPPRPQDLDQLIHWQMRKAAPFRMEDAQFAYQQGAALPGGGREFIVTVARRDIVHAYERACDTAGVHAGLVDLTTFNQINAVLAGGATTGDWLLVNVAVDYATIALVRDGEVIFFRNRATEGEGDLVELVHQTAMYHEDRLGGAGFTRVVLAGTSVLGQDEAERFRRTLAERVGGAVEPIDFRPGAEMSDRIAPGAEITDRLAPAVGMLLRDRVRMPARAASGVA